MSVKIENITKLYGAQKALDNVSFEIPSGQVVGLLGPNGAGKSTLMKIISCYISQTSGKAWVAGFDVNEQSLEVRRNVGYLPEHTPLYLDMYVKEYLEFIGGMHELGKQTWNRVEKMIALTGLQAEQNKKIGALSKGYRQRVGLAQALIHDPKVLILDEPTSGLDPNQLSEIRGLIKEIGKEKTVILSTHIMQEVKAVCNRVLIINKGKIVADDKTENITSGAGESVILIEFDNEANETLLRQIEGITNMEKIKDTTWKIRTVPTVDIRPELFRFAVENGLTVLSLQKQEQDLESIFQQLTR